tara:strand:+ start:218 stop:1891 length:1674 start_codon:yes stop_codon:yes gene_type:complete
MVLRIPADRATEFANYQGSSRPRTDGKKPWEGYAQGTSRPLPLKSGNPNACKGKEQEKKNIGSMASQGGAAEDIAKSIGMNQECQKAASAHLSQSMLDTDTMAGAITLFGGGVASNSTTSTNLDVGSSMMEKGCGSFAVAASTIMNETAAISCTMNSTLTGQTVEVKSGARITIKTKRPSERAIAAILKVSDKNSQRLADAIKKEVRIPANVPPHMLPLYMKKFEVKEASISKMEAANADYSKSFPINADVVNSSIEARMSNTVTMKTEQKITGTHKTQIENSIKNIAMAAAEQKMSADMGFQAGSANSKQIIQNKINNMYTDEKNAIDEKITNSFTKAVSDNEILIEVEGSIIGSDIVADMSIQTNVQTKQAVTSGISMGHRIAAEMTSDIASYQEGDTKIAGMDDLVKEANEGLAKQILAKGESDANTYAGMGEGFAGFGDMIGAAFSGLALLFMIPLLVILGVLFFAPKLVSGFIPPQLKVPLMIGVVVLILLIVFGGIFSSSESRRFPTSNEFMSVDDNLADTLGYMVTETKGRINKKPYEDVNFTAGGTWRI